MEHEICSVDIRKANNGYVVDYCEKRKPMNGGTYASMTHVHQSQVFKDNEMEKAFELFKKLKIQSFESKEKEEYDYD